MANMYDRAYRIDHRISQKEKVNDGYALEPGTNKNFNDLSYCALQMPGRVVLKFKRIESFGVNGQSVHDSTEKAVRDLELLHHKRLLLLDISHEREVKKLTIAEIKAIHREWLVRCGVKIANETHDYVVKRAQSKEQLRRNNMAFMAIQKRKRATAQEEIANVAVAAIPMVQPLGGEVGYRADVDFDQLQVPMVQQDRNVRKQPKRVANPKVTQPNPSLAAVIGNQATGNGVPRFGGRLPSGNGIGKPRQNNFNGGGSGGGNGGSRGRGYNRGGGRYGGGRGGRRQPFQ